MTTAPHALRMLFEEDIDIELKSYPPSIKKFNLKLNID